MIFILKLYQIHNKNDKNDKNDKMIIFIFVKLFII